MSRHRWLSWKLEPFTSQQFPAGIAFVADPAPFGRGYLAFPDWWSSTTHKAAQKRVLLA